MLGMASPFSFLAAASRRSSFGALGARSGKLYDARGIVEWLAKYLNDSPDEYDVFEYVRYAPEAFSFGWSIDEEELSDMSLDDVPAEEREAFAKWAQSRKAKEEVVAAAHKTGDTPPWLFYSHARVEPARQWYLHFSDETFDAFDRGANYEGLGITGRHPTFNAKCPANITNTVGPAEVVWGFALHVEHGVRHAGSWARKYGRNAMLFQTDYAVSAYHSGDDEHQVIFPLCSEYNLVSIYDAGESPHIDLRAPYEGRHEVEFDSLRAAVEWVTSDVRRAARLGAISPSRMQRVFAALRAGEARAAKRREASSAGGAP